MGSRLSSLGTSSRTFRNRVKRWARRVVQQTQSSSKRMATHARLLVDTLKLGPLRVKIHRVKHLDNSDDITDIGAESNLDIVSGIGTAGDARTLHTDLEELEERFSVFSGDDVLAPVNLTPVNLPPNPNPGPNVNNADKNKRKSIVSQMANQLMDKVKGDFKTFDLFFLGTNAKALTARQLYKHALDCHQAVIELGSQMDALLEIISKAGNAVNPPRRVSFKQAEVLISPGMILRGTIKVPPMDEEEQENRNDENDEGNGRGRHHHRLTNLDPSFSNVQQHQNRPYEIEILREHFDEVGMPYLIGRHKTYNGKRDKQSIVLHVRDVKAGNMSPHQDAPMRGRVVAESDVYFEDYETHCEGAIEGQYRLSGNVRQLKQGQPGFYVHGRAAEQYKFDVARTDESRSEQVNDIRSKLNQAKYARALAFAAWAGASSASRVVNERFVGFTIDWAEVLEDMVWICDEIGNTIRRYVILLKDLRFKNPNARTKIMEDLAVKGLRRARIHEIWDAGTVLCGHLRDHTPAGSVHDANKLAAAGNFADKVLGRLEPVYNRFDVALRKAEKKVCEELKMKFTQIYQPALVRKLSGRSLNGGSQRSLVMDDPDNDPDFQNDTASQGTRATATAGATGQRQLPTLNRRLQHPIQTKASQQSQASMATGTTRGEEPMCAICSDTFERGTQIYVTSCAHAFHIACLNDWFQQGSDCPICRNDFSEAAR